MKPLFYGATAIAAAILSGGVWAQDENGTDAGISPKTTVTTSAKPPPVVRVHSTVQRFDFVRPWTKRTPSTLQGIGAVLPGNRVLVTSELVANANYIEFEKAQGGATTPAVIEAVDYDANLALLRPSSPEFLSGVPAFKLADAKVGDEVAVWQLEKNGALLATSAILTAVDLDIYDVGNRSLLVYKVTSPLQYREGSFTLPVVKGGKLLGMLMSYDSRTKNIDVVPVPVIQHFLKAVDMNPYGGFPQAGFVTVPMRDPQLRKFAGLKNGDDAGLYVTRLAPYATEQPGGLRVGDVILAIDGRKVDQDGNYDDPDFGKISIAHLLSSKYFSGDVVPFKILRDGQPLEAKMTMRHRKAEDYVIPPYIVDRPPGYYILGGLVFQELSRPYLQEWGKEWRNRAPRRYVYYDQFQDELFGQDRGRVIILSQIIPSPATLGLDDVSLSAVTKLNGRPIRSLADLEAAAKEPVDGFHKVELEEDPHVIYLDAAQVETQAEALKKNYRLPALLEIP
jgi:S1-C subfamily serine protease